MLFGGTCEATDQNTTLSDEIGEAYLSTGSGSMVLASHRSGSYLQADAVAAVSTSSDLDDRGTGGTKNGKKADNEAFASGSGRTHLGFGRGH